MSYRGLFVKGNLDFLPTYCENTQKESRQEWCAGGQAQGCSLLNHTSLDNLKWVEEVLEDNMEYDGAKERAAFFTCCAALKYNLK